MEPTGWKLLPLEAVIGLKRGFDLPAARRVSGDVPVVGSAGISGWHNEVMAKGPGVVVGRAGSSMGVATFVERDFWPLNTALFVEDFRGNDPRFVYALLRNLDFSGYNSGAAQPMLNRNYIKAIRVLLPGRREQCAISSLLGSLDDKIQVNERIAAASEELLQSFFLRQGFNDHPVNGSGVRADFLIDFNPRITKPKASTAVYVDMAALPTESARVRQWTRRAPAGGARFVNGDTLLARITPCLENGKTAFIDFMGPGEVGIGSTEFIVLRAKQHVPQHFPYLLARSPRFRAHAVASMVGSSGRQRCQADPLTAYLLPKPDERQLVELGDQCEHTFALLKSLDDESSRLAELRDTLLPKLVSGQIRIKDAERAVEEAV